MKLLIFVFTILISNAVHAACSSPAGVAGQVQYISSDMKYCDGTNWNTMTESNLGTGCSGEGGKISWLSPNLRFCNGSTWIKMNTSTTAGSAAGTLAGTMRYHSGSQKMQVSNATNWYELGVTPIPPSGISITHSDNNRKVYVTWTGGSDMMGDVCYVKYKRNGSVWTTFGTLSCSTNYSSHEITLDSPFGLVASWATTDVDVKVSDYYDNTITTFTGKLKCNPIAASTTPTADIDEDCNKAWDNLDSFAQSVAVPNIGAAYNCPGGFGTFEKVYFEADFTHYGEATCLTAYYTLTHCSISTSQSGTVPSTANKEDYDGDCDWSSSGSVSAGSTACQNIVGQYMKRNSTQWDRQRCFYYRYN